MQQDVVSQVVIRRTTPADVDSSWRCLDAVARERRWLTMLSASPIEQMRLFLTKEGLIQFVAVHKDEVVGWCHVVPETQKGMRHCAVLGMGLLADYRERGLGRRLLEETLRAAYDAGITRVELEVFASNVAAIKLYERLGFAHEGRKQAARILDGRTEDMLCMAVVTPRDERRAATDYSGDWRRLHGLWVAQTLLWLLFLPVIALLATAIMASTAFQTPLIVIGLTWMVAIVVTSIRGASFRCPRCAKLFFIKGLATKGVFTRESKRVCAYCGLAVGG